MTNTAWESRNIIKARLNKQGWPCSDKALFFPPMYLWEDNEDGEDDIWFQTNSLPLSPLTVSH
jgi:hypothetical protein